ncbi:MAG: DUF5724 domain-containing protein, partial [Chloroflexota bacterium]
MMLTPEQAHDYLASRMIKDAANQRLEAIAALPDEPLSDKLAAITEELYQADEPRDLSLREIAYGILLRDKNGKSFRPEGYISYGYNRPKEEIEAHRKGYLALEALAPADRVLIFTAYFPKMAREIELLWEFMPTLPYQLGYRRKAFRAPGHTDLYQAQHEHMLDNLLAVIGGYYEDVLWFAQYSGYLFHGYGSIWLDKLFAAVIDANVEASEPLFQILLASGRGDHEIGIMGRHVTRGLLTASRPDGWTFVEKLLLAAQRQEGLRQEILEAVDEAHPEAFRRILRVILDNDLVRFSAVTRAMNVWFGFAWDSESTRVINQTLEQTMQILENADVRAEALRSGSGEAVYLALWALAWEDAFQAISAAQPLLSDPIMERRFAAVHLLVNLGLSETYLAIAQALNDPDLHIAVQAAEGIDALRAPERDNLFETIEALLLRLPKDETPLAPILWPWLIVTVRRSHVAADLLTTLGERSPKSLLPYMLMFDAGTRTRAAREIAKVGMGDPEVRAVLIKLIGDRDGYVRQQMIELFEEYHIQPDEAPYIESLLTRKADDLRRGVLSLLSHQPPDQAVTSAAHLIEQRPIEQRLAGLELLQILHQRGEAVEQCRAQAQAYRDTQEKWGEVSEAENSLIDSMIGEAQPELTLDNAFGLMNPAKRSAPVPPRPHEVVITTPAALLTLRSLDELIDQHSTEPLQLKTWQGENQEVLLANANYGFPQTDWRVPISEDLPRLLLRDLWQQWVEARPTDLRDEDGLELIRALMEAKWQEMSQRSHQMQGTPQNQQEDYRPKYPQLCISLLHWLMRLYPALNTSDFLLDCMEDQWAAMPENNLRQQQNQWPGYYHWSYGNTPSKPILFLNEARQRGFQSDSDWEDRHMRRLWGFLRWMDEPLPDVPRQRPVLEEVVAAHKIGAATDDDLYDQLLGDRTFGDPPRMGHFDDLDSLSRRSAHPLVQDYAPLAQIYARCRDRVLEIELKRGEMPTLATPPAQAIRAIPGTYWFVRILQAMGKQSIARDRYGTSRSTIFGHLLHGSFPTETDSVEAFAKQVKTAKLPEKQLIDAAVYAPQWAAHIEQALKWKGFVEAVWWLHAHTKDRRWFPDQGLRESWNAEVNSRTPLSGDDLLEGAVDVDWFWKMHKQIGAARWEKVYAAAKYSSGGIGHNRAKLFADAMLGRVESAALVKRILEKRNQDAARALGLIPLSKKRDAEILSRYQALQEFLRTGRKSGAQRRENEKRAVAIAMENLARTAGYPDPQRLQWAMESHEVADLKSGSIHVTVDDLTVTLRIDLLGKPQIEIVKGTKRLQAVPNKYRKQAEIVALRDRKAQIDKQHSRMRLSLENAMCRADHFSAKELRTLLEHPVLAPMLEQVIFVGEGLIGYPVDNGQALEKFEGSVASLRPDTSLRIAHAYDLYQSGDWHLWQRDCFLAERIQPFKQVFRELYLVTEAERAEGGLSRRYAGHQVQPRQAVALLGSRGWLAHPDYGVQKTFHGQNLSVHLDFLNGYFTPTEVEGLTIDRVIFTQNTPWKVVQLADLPPITFSEAMRDLDLVVSVAHRGGVDPESTASTVEMRSALIRETMALLKIANVKLQSNHALIEGGLGNYSV